MLGPFTVSDSFRLYRLQRKGISLDLRQALTKSHAPLWGAWLAFLTQQAMGQPTHVLHDIHDGDGFIQVEYRPHQAAADVVYLAPALDVEKKAAPIWFKLLDGACTEAAGRGIQRVFANLPDSGLEVELFNQVGFTPYASEDIFCRESQVQTREPNAGFVVRELRPEDWPAVQKLCVAVTPQRIRQAEGGIAFSTGIGESCHRLVVPSETGQTLVALLSICLGELAHWIRVVIHPDSHQLAGDIVQQGLNRLKRDTIKPVYCNVRQYESGLHHGLEDAGFSWHATRTLMVKHTVAWVKTPLQELMPSLATGAEPVPRPYRLNGEADLPAADGRLAAKN